MTRDEFNTEPFPPAGGPDDQPRAAMIAGYNALVAAGDHVNADFMKQALRQCGIESDGNDGGGNWTMLTDDMALAMFG